MQSIKMSECSWISIFGLVLEPGNLYYLHNYVPSTKNSRNDKSMINEYLLARHFYTLIIHQLAYIVSILYTLLTVNFSDIVNKCLKVSLALVIDK